MQRSFTLSGMWDLLGLHRLFARLINLRSVKAERCSRTPNWLLSRAMHCRRPPIDCKSAPAQQVPHELRPAPGYFPSTVPQFNGLLTKGSLNSQKRPTSPFTFRIRAMNQHCLPSHLAEIALHCGCGGRGPNVSLPRDDCRAPLSVPGRKHKMGQPCSSG
jgi:hypothetical protein